MLCKRQLKLPPHLSSTPPPAIIRIHCHGISQTATVIPASLSSLLPLAVFFQSSKLPLLRVSLQGTPLPLCSPIQGSSVLHSLSPQSLFLVQTPSSCPLCSATAQASSSLRHQWFLWDNLGLGLHKSWETSPGLMTEDGGSNSME